MDPILKLASATQHYIYILIGSADFLNSKAAFAALCEHEKWGLHPTKL